MSISYHKKERLCTIIDKVHKAFINSAKPPSHFTFYRLLTVKRYRRSGGRAAAGDERFFLLYRKQTRNLPPIQRRAAGGEITLEVSVHSGRLRRPGDAGSPAGDKRGKGHRMVPFPPLDSPKPSFEPLSKAFAAKRGLRGLGSVRRFAFGTLYRPECTLHRLRFDQA